MSRTLKGIEEVTRVAQLTGPGSANATDTRWNLHGTDLGHMFSMGDRLYMVFGDSYGRGFTPPPDNESARYAWRSNTMAVIQDPKPANGLIFEGMIADDAGHARELLPARHDTSGRSEFTVIPTGGIAIGGRMVLHSMSVRRWGAPGRWTVNHSGLASSDDGGATWIKAAGAEWPAASNFIQAALIQVGSDVYFFGIPAGRFGPVRLGCVPAAEILNPRAYRYLYGFDAGRPQWGEHEGEGIAIVPAPVGEPSVMWNDFLGRWMMTCLDEPARAIVIREAPQPWGPWSLPQILVHADDYPGLYGGYLHPWLVERNGEVVYFTMSQWVSYNVFLMRARLIR